MGGNFVSESIDEEKLRMKERASDFMALPETQKRIKGIIGRGQRLDVNIDEIRALDPKLS
jgi:hypothetical protein